MVDIFDMPYITGLTVSTVFYSYAIQAIVVAPPSASSEKILYTNIQGHLLVLCNLEGQNYGIDP